MVSHPGGDRQMRGPLRELSSAENQGRHGPAWRRRRTPAEPGPTKACAADAGCGPRVAYLSGVQRNEAPHGIPLPVSRPANAPVDLPRVPAGIHERLVQEKPQAPDRSGLCPTSSRGKESRTENPRIPRRPPLRGLRGGRRGGSRLRPFAQQAGQRESPGTHRGFLEPHRCGDLQVRGSLRELSPPPNRECRRVLPGGRR